MLHLERTVAWDLLQKEILEKMQCFLRPTVCIQVCALVRPPRPPCTRMPARAPPPRGSGAQGSASGGAGGGCPMGPGAGAPWGRERVSRGAGGALMVRTGGWPSFRGGSWLCRDPFLLFV